MHVNSDRLGQSRVVDTGPGQEGITPGPGPGSSPANRSEPLETELNQVYSVTPNA